MRLALLCIPVLARCAGAQAISIQCMAQDQGTMWPIRGGASSAPDAVPAYAALMALMTGKYKVDLVTTEGVETASVSHWQIVILPADTSARAFPGIVRRWRPILVGTRTDLPRQTPSDSLREGRFLGGEADFEMVVDSVTGHLSWSTAPGTLDGGRIFTVADVDSGGFTGRWEDGGIGMAILHRGGLTVGERERGYYCARKIQ